MDVHKRHGGLNRPRMQDIGDCASFLGNGSAGDPLRAPTSWGLTLSGDGRSSVFRNDNSLKILHGEHRRARGEVQRRTRPLLQTSAARMRRTGGVQSGDRDAVLRDRDFWRFTNPDLGAAGLER